MKKSDQILLAILKDQVVPALGCTEPGAVAYAVARAKRLLGGEEVTQLTIQVDKNILKNGMDVGIPGTSERGLVFAAALSLVAGNSDYGLEVFRDVKEGDVKKAQDIVDTSIITLEHNKEVQGLYIAVQARGETGESRVVLKDSHTNIVHESVNGRVLLEQDSAAGDGASDGNGAIKFAVKGYDFDELIDFADRVPAESLMFIQDGLDMNLHIAKIGILKGTGVGIGSYLYSQAASIYDKAKAYTAAAAEARMSGYPLPVMSSAGSGSHGLTATLPIAIIGEGLGFPRENILRAVALSHLVTIYVKVYLGLLSPICGCGIAAGTGAAAGLTYLQGGDKTQIKQAISNMVAGVAGMLCDGAKLGCSYKLSISVGAAIDASSLALNHVSIPPQNGILGLSAEQTVQNLVTVCTAGMKCTDDIIVDVMLHHRCM